MSLGRGGKTARRFPCFFAAASWPNPLLPVRNLAGVELPASNRTAEAGAWRTPAAGAVGIFSFISYRVAQVQRVAQVALEAGNSPKIIFSNYRELVKPVDTVKWFALESDTPANVIQAPMAAAAA